MSLLARVGEEQPLLASYRVEEPEGGRYEAMFDDDRRAFVLEAVYEGYLLHYEEPRAFAGMDPDLRLLAGDALYALGLARLAEVGDLEAIAELADLISLSAQAALEGRRDVIEELWRASAEALLPAGGRGARAVAGPLLDSPPKPA